MATNIQPTYYEGEIKPFVSTKSFYMVIVEGGTKYPHVKHENYEDAFAECNRLSQLENKTAYVVKAITKIKQISNVTQLEI
jgi:hypothetical protein